MAIAVLAISIPASATIISGSVTGGTAFANGGTFVKLPVPFTDSTPDNTVGDDTFQNNNLYGFDEDQNITLAAALDVDAVAAPYLNPLPIGTTVASHYVFFDPGPSRSIVGTVNFDSKVVAIISSTGFLLASDFLANTGVTYLNPGLRGLEPGDSVTISGPNQILFNTTASSPGDYVRVLTEFSPGAVVPEPGTISMLGLGLGLALFYRKALIRRR